MKTLLAIFVFLSCISCKPKKVITEVVGTPFMEKNIVLFNIRNDNRTQIADLLLEIDKCSPSVIGIDAIFEKYENPARDSSLTKALMKISNEIIAYRFDSTGKLEKSAESFAKHATNQGYVNIVEKNGVLTHLIPITKINGIQYKSFVLEIIQASDPKFELKIRPNVEIPITFQRPIDKYYIFVREDLKDKNVCEFLKGKIVMIGYLGPGENDKYFTPLRFINKTNNNRPDTYGLVILSNAISTILEYRE